MDIKISTPLTKEKIQGLNAGDKVLLSGTIYTLRDAGHKRLLEQIEKQEDLPISMEKIVIYYTGPSPNKPNQIIGSSGPTTSYRMDPYTPRLLDLGLSGMIGKGDRSKEVIDSMIKNQAVYFAAVGGAGALLSSCIQTCKTVAYDDLMTESLKELVVVDFPVIVAIDCRGNNLYETEKRKYNK